MIDSFILDKKKIFRGWMVKTFVNPFLRIVRCGLGHEEERDKIPISRSHRSISLFFKMILVLEFWKVLCFNDQYVRRRNTCKAKSTNAALRKSVKKFKDLKNLMGSGLLRLRLWPYYFKECEDERNREKGVTAS